MKNKLIIAGAGTGKTTHIINEALKENKRILITTYTIKCKNEIEDKICEQIGFIPKNVIIQSWFSFLLEHGIKPYKNIFNIDLVNGLCFVNRKSGFKYNKGKIPIYYGEKEFQKYYFDNNERIYSDKLSKLVIRINEKANDLVFNRIAKIFDTIYVDEVQDLVGYDLEIIKKLSENVNNLTLVGDPRQKVYDTHIDKKYNKYNNGNIDNFVKEGCEKSKFKIDYTSLNICRRSYKDIVKFLNQFYPEYGELKYEEKKIKEHQGIYIVRSYDVNEYLKKYNPMQMRYDKKVNINFDYKYINYRKSKGCTYQRTLIYPTEELKKYINGNHNIKDNTTKNILYVALSRAVDSLAIVYDGNVSDEFLFKIWNKKLAKT